MGGGRESIICNSNVGWGIAVLAEQLIDIISSQSVDIRITSFQPYQADNDFSLFSFHSARKNVSRNGYPLHCGRLGEFSKVMQTRDAVEGLHNCREFSQPSLVCLDEAM